MSLSFGAAFDKLERDVKSGIVKNLLLRKTRYLEAMGGKSVKTKVVLLGDTPGPGRPNDPGYHHTPFYSTKNSSLWINRLLWDHCIPEEDLLWFNTTLADGSPLDSKIFFNQLHGDPAVICLGGNAEKWILTHALYRIPCGKVHHPQAWKRFHSKEPYPLIDLLESALDLNKVCVKLVKFRLQ